MHRILAAAALLGATAVPTSPAHAEHTVFDCVMDGAVVSGYIVSPLFGEPVTIRSDVRRAGSVVGYTPTGSGMNVAVTWGVTAPGDMVCAEATAGSHTEYVCHS